MKVEERYHRVDQNTHGAHRHDRRSEGVYEAVGGAQQAALRLMPPNTDLMEMIPSATEAAEYKKVFAK